MVASKGWKGVGGSPLPLQKPFSIDLPIDGRPRPSLAVRFIILMIFYWNDMFHPICSPRPTFGPFISKLFSPIVRWFNGCYSGIEIATVKGIGSAGYLNWRGLCNPNRPVQTQLSKDSQELKP
jgi:hypothetical protein